MTRLIDKQPVYLELYEAIAHFVGRQQLVVQAVIDLGVMPKDLVRGVSGWHDKTPDRGMWGDEWRFAFHGSGCLLENVHTGECIDWNAPDPLSFDTYFFTRHLEWRLEHESGLLLLRAFIQERGSGAVARLIDDLVADGVISSGHSIIPSAGRIDASAA